MKKTMSIRVDQELLEEIKTKLGATTNNQVFNLLLEKEAKDLSKEFKKLNTVDKNQQLIMIVLASLYKNMVTPENNFLTEVDLLKPENYFDQIYSNARKKLSERMNDAKLG